MKRIRLLAHESRKQAAVKKLHELGAVQITDFRNTLNRSEWSDLLQARQAVGVGIFSCRSRIAVVAAGNINLCHAYRHRHADVDNRCNLQVWFAGHLVCIFLRVVLG